MIALSLSRWHIRALSVGASAATVALFDYARHQWFPQLLQPQLAPWAASLVMLVAVFIVVYGMAEGFFWLFRRERRSLLLGAGEVAALNSVFQESGQPGQRGLAPVLSSLAALMKSEVSLLYLAREDGTGFHLADAVGVQGAGLEAMYPDGLMDPSALKSGVSSLAAKVDRWADVVGLKARLRSLGFPHVTCLPLVARERLLGVVVLAGAARPPVYYRDQGVLALLGTQLGGMVDGMRLIEKLEEKESEARELYTLTAELSRRLDVQEVRRVATERARAILHVDSAALCALESDTSGRMVTTYSPERPGSPSPINQATPCARLVGATKSPTAYDSNEVDCPVLSAGKRQVHLTAPLEVGGEKLGVLCVAREGMTPATQEELRLLGEVASRTAMALKNAWLHQHIQELAITEERDRIAREMHDSLAQVLGYLHLKARATMLALERDASRARSDLKEMAEVAQEAYVDVREAILGLREAPGPGRTLPELVQSYLDKYQRQSGISASLEVQDGAPVKFTPQVEVQLVRIIQESLTNVRKHAGATEVRVSFARENNEAVITVEDNGRGFDAAVAIAQRQGFGLTSMRERVQLISGKLEITSLPGAGTRVVARVPIV